MIKVSVIIPIYNVENYIRECVESVCRQTLQDIEIICVNDGSSDSSMSIVEEYAIHDDRVYIVNKENGGLSSARNAGLDVAKGEYVYFLDSDDYIKEDTLEYLYSHAKKDNLDNIYFDAEAFYENNDVEKKNEHYKTYYCRPGIFDDVVTGQELFARMENMKCYRPSACLQMPKRSLLIEHSIRFYEGIVHEDQLFSLQVIFLTSKVKHVAQPFYMRRVRNDSIMTTKQEFRNTYGYFVCLVEFRKFIASQNIENPDVLKAIKHRMHALQSLAINDIKTLTYKDLQQEIQQYPLEQQYEFDTLIMSFVQERQNQVARRKKIEKELKRTKQSTTFRLGKAVLFVPKSIASLYKLIANKGIICTCNTLQRKIKHEKRQLNSQEVLVSIVIPVYNAERYLRGCLNRLCTQTLRGIEIICVNDGSTDNSQLILEEYAKKDSRVKALYQENQGAGAARNHGLSKVRGEYVLFLDADDIYDKRLCEEAYYKAKNDMADIVLFGANRLNMKTTKKEPMDWVLKTNLLPSKSCFSVKQAGKRIYQITTACPWSKMFRVDFVKKQKLQFQNTKNANDVFFVRTALATAKRITVLDKRLITYRYNDGDNIQSKKSQAPMEFYKAFKALKEELMKRGVYKQVEQSYVNMVLKESLFNLKTAGSEEAKQMIHDMLSTEGFAFFEIDKYNKDYFYDVKEYKEYEKIFLQK